MIGVVYAHVCRLCPHLATVHRATPEMPEGAYACQLCECIGTQADFGGQADEITVTRLYGTSLRWLAEQVSKRNNDQDRVAAAAAAWAAGARRRALTMCRAESDVVMSPLAQRLHGGRVHFTCGRAGGHPGPHRWPADPNVPALAEWGKADRSGVSPGQARPEGQGV